MKKTQLEWLKRQLNKCDYVHIGQWGGKNEWDIEGSIIELIEENETLRKALEDIKTYADRPVVIRIATEALSDSQSEAHSEETKTDSIITSEETRKSIKRGLKQKGTIDRGSFAKYADSDSVDNSLD